MITQAGNDPKVRALVYVAAFALLPCTRPCPVAPSSQKRTPSSSKPTFALRIGASANA